jgi:hypothetical protein
MRDRRREARLRSARLVEVAHDGDAAYARCRDFSDTGMKLDLTSPLELNDSVTIALTPSLVLCGTVAWVKGLECGIVFDDPLDSASLLEAAEPAQDEPETPATADVLDGRQAQPRFNASRRTPPRRPGASFQPGLAVTVMVGPNCEARGVVHWATGNVAAIELASPGIEERQTPQGLLAPPTSR